MHCNSVILSAVAECSVKIFDVVYVFAADINNTLVAAHNKDNAIVAGHNKDNTLVAGHNKDNTLVAGHNKDNAIPAPGSGLMQVPYHFLHSSAK